MKLFFGLNPTPNQINDMNLKAGSPRKISNDAPEATPRSPHNSPTPKMQNGERNTQTAKRLSGNIATEAEHIRDFSAALSMKPETSGEPQNTSGHESQPNVSDDKDTSGILHADKSDASLAQGNKTSVKTECPTPPPSPSPESSKTDQSSADADIADEPSTVVNPANVKANDKSNAQQENQANVEPNGESNVQQAIPANVKANDTSNEQQENPEIIKMRQEMEHMRAELERLKQPASHTQESAPQFLETKAAEMQPPPPLPNKEPSSTAIPAIPVDSPNDGASIQLQAYSGKTMTITGDTIVNFTNTRGLNGDDFQYLDHTEQYRISRQGRKWVITPGRNTRNATMLNYLPLTGPEVLEDDDTISISIPGSNVHKMTLTVKFLS